MKALFKFILINYIILTFIIPVLANSGDERINSFQVCKDGSIIAVGYTTTKSKGFADYWIIKFDKDGNKQWEKTYGGKRNDEANSIYKSKDGFFYITGFSFSKIEHKYALWIIKIDNKGEIQWEKTFTNMKYSYRYPIQVTKDNGLLISLSKKGKDENETSLWIIKLDKKGKQQWEKIYKAEYNLKTYAQIIGDVCQTANDEFLLLSLIAGSTHKYKTSYDIRCLKMNNKGKILWSKSYTKNIVNGHYFMARLIIPAQDNGYIIASHVWTQEFNNDMLITKINEEGNIIWEKIYNRKHNQQIYSIQSTKDKNYLIEVKSKNHYWIYKINKKGDIIWEKNFNNLINLPVIISKENTYYIFGTSKTNKKQVLKIIKINKDGDILWEKDIGDHYGNTPRKIEMINDILYIAGSKFESKNGQDAWIAKMDNDGKMIWDKKIGEIAVPYQRRREIYNISLKSFNHRGEKIWQRNLTEFSNKSESIILKLDDNNYLITGSIKAKKKDQYYPCLIKIDKDNNIIWKKIYKKDLYISYNTLKIGNNIFLAGLKVISLKGKYVYAVTRLNEKGDIVWQKEYGNTYIPIYIGSIQHFDDNHFVMVYQDRSSSLELHIAKIDLLGNTIWDKKISESTRFYFPPDSLKKVKNNYLLTVYQLTEYCYLKNSGHLRLKQSYRLKTGDEKVLLT